MAKSTPKSTTAPDASASAKNIAGERRLASEQEAFDDLESESSESSDLSSSSDLSDASSASSNLSDFSSESSELSSLSDVSSASSDLSSSSSSDESQSSPSDASSFSIVSESSLSELSESSFSELSESSVSSESSDSSPSSFSIVSESSESILSDSSASSSLSSGDNFFLLDPTFEFTNPNASDYDSFTVGYINLSGIDPVTVEISSSVSSRASSRRVASLSPFDEQPFRLESIDVANQTMTFKAAEGIGPGGITTQSVMVVKGASGEIINTLNVGVKVGPTWKDLMQRSALEIDMTPLLTSINGPIQSNAAAVPFKDTRAKIVISNAIQAALRAGSFEAGLKLGLSATIDDVAQSNNITLAPDASVSFKLQLGQSPTFGTWNLQGEFGLGWSDISLNEATLTGEVKITGANFNFSLGRWDVTGNFSLGYKSKNLENFATGSSSQNSQTVFQIGVEF